MDTDPTPSLHDFLAATRWFGVLEPGLQALALRTSSELAAPPGGFIARQGEPCTHWYGLIDGLAHMYMAGGDGSETTLLCLHKGEWAGEGSLLKNERRRYDVRALTRVRMCLVPADTFQTLRHTSIAFNHYLCDALNQRMGAFVGLLAATRLLGPELRLAHSLLMLTTDEPDGARQSLSVSQQELALMCGLSRQRVNAAMGDLKALGLVFLEPNRSQVMVDVARLQRYVATEGRGWEAATG